MNREIHHPYFNVRINTSNYRLKIVSLYEAFMWKSSGGYCYSDGFYYPNLYKGMRLMITMQHHRNIGIGQHDITYESSVNNGGNKRYFHGGLHNNGTLNAVRHKWLYNE